MKTSSFAPFSCVVIAASAVACGADPTPPAPPADVTVPAEPLPPATPSAPPSAEPPAGSSPAPPSATWCASQPGAAFCADFDGATIAAGFDRSPCSIASGPLVTAASPRSLPHALRVTDSGCDLRLVKAVPVTGARRVRVAFAVRADAVGTRGMYPLHLALSNATAVRDTVVDVLFVTSQDGSYLTLRAAGEADRMLLNGPPLEPGRWANVAFELTTTPAKDGWSASLVVDGNDFGRMENRTKPKPFDTAVLVLGDHDATSASDVPFDGALDDVRLDVE